MKNQGKPKQRIIRIVGGVLFVLIALPFVLSGSKEKSSKTEIQPSEATKMAKIKDSLNIILKPKNLDVCTIIHELEQIQLDCIHKADKEFPDFRMKVEDSKKHSDYSFQCIQESRLTYGKKHGLSKDFITLVTAFTMECTEAERQASIQQAKEKKREKEKRKEKIEDCLQTASIDLRYKLKGAAHNPKLFEEVSSEYNGNNDEVFEIKYTFRAENEYGAIRIKTIFAKVNIENCSIIEITE